MKKNILLSVLLVMTGVFSSVAQGKQSYVVEVDDFTQLLVTDNINVEYHCRPDSTGYAKFTAVPDMANQLIFTNNRKGKLSISVGTDSVYNRELPCIVVYSSFLQSAENQGDSTLHIKSIAPAAAIKFKLMDNGAIVVDKVEANKLDVEILTGKGSITVNGKCTELNAKNTGKGTINAEGLHSTDVNCRMLGTGKVYCNVDGGILTLKGSGTGKLYYHGKPYRVKEFQLGALKAVSLDNNAE